MAYTFARVVRPAVARSSAIASTARVALRIDTRGPARLAPLIGASRDVALPVAKENALVGIVALIVSTMFYSTSDIMSKYLTGSLPAVEVAWLRYVVFFAAVLPMLLVDGSRLLRTERRKLQLLRGATTVVSTMLFVLALLHMPVAEATSIGFAAPLFITALAIVFLGEQVGIRRWSAILVGLVGVLIIVQPGTSAFQLASLLPLCGALVSAGSIIALRLMKNERAETTMIYSALIGVTVLTVVTMFEWVTPTWRELGIGLLGGICVTIANLMQIFAYRHAPASMLAPFSYTQLIWASGLGYLVFGLFPGSATLVGGSIIAASGLYTAYRERIRARAASAAGNKRTPASTPLVTPLP